MQPLLKKKDNVPKRQSPKLKGAKCNVPKHVVNICNKLPRPVDINAIFIVKASQKLQYEGHV